MVNEEHVNLVSRYSLEMLKGTEKDLKNQYISYFKLTKEEISSKCRNPHLEILKRIKIHGQK